jgi:hypothetical protein
MATTTWDTNLKLQRDNALKEKGFAYQSLLQYKQGLYGYQRLNKIVMKVALTGCETSNGILGS